jgi:hypothetical protein
MRYQERLASDSLVRQQGGATETTSEGHAKARPKTIRAQSRNPTEQAGKEKSGTDRIDLPLRQVQRLFHGGTV